MAGVEGEAGWAESKGKDWGLASWRRHLWGPEGLEFQKDGNPTGHMPQGSGASEPGQILYLLLSATKVPFSQGFKTV